MLKNSDNIFFMIFFQLGVDKPSDLKEEKANV